MGACSPSNQHSPLYFHSGGCRWTIAQMLCASPLVQVRGKDSVNSSMCMHITILRGPGMKSEAATQQLKISEITNSHSPLMREDSEEQDRNCMEGDSLVCISVCISVLLGNLRSKLLQSHSSAHIRKQARSSWHSPFRIALLQTSA